MQRNRGRNRRKKKVMQRECKKRKWSKTPVTSLLARRNLPRTPEMPRVTVTVTTIKADILGHSILYCTDMYLLQDH